MPIPKVKPRRRRLPGASDDAFYRVYMITTFWVAVAGALMLFFFHWLWGATVLGLCILAFLGGMVFGG